MSYITHKVNIILFLAALIFTRQVLGQTRYSKLTTALRRPLSPPLDSSPVAPNASSNNVLIVYYSYTAGGCTERMAHEVARGATNVSANVRVLKVSDTNCSDVLWADAVIVGSPVHFSNPASEIVRFFEDLQNVCFGWPLTALEMKVGGAFVDGGGLDKGKDTTLQSIHGALMSMRFVVRGCTEGTCNAWGATATNPDHPGVPPSPLSTDEVAAAQDLGRKIAELSDIIWHGKPLRD